MLMGKVHKKITGAFSPIRRVMGEIPSMEVNHISRIQHDDDFDLEEACADVADACAKRNIEFDFRYSPHFPPFPLSPRDVH